MHRMLRDASPSTLHDLLRQTLPSLLATLCAAVSFVSAFGAPIRSSDQDSAGDTVELTVEVRASGEAPILIELHGSEANWKSDTDPVAAVTLPPGERLWTVKVPPGSYAARAFQDLDGDGELEKNRIGLPTEPFGFSRDAKPRFGPPGWGRTHFEVREDDRVVFKLRGGPKQAERLTRSYEAKQNKDG